MPQSTFDFEQIGRLPQIGDNVAIATQTLPAGTRVVLRGRHIRLTYTVLVGHRFAVEPIAVGEPLLSWGLPFGIATAPIEPGGYVCNRGVVETLRERSFDSALGYTFPQQPNFRDRIVPYSVDEASFHPGKQVERQADGKTFWGFRRGTQRGVGTRNVVVLLATTSSTSSFVRVLAQRLHGVREQYPHIDAIVPVAHTEGSGYIRINNRTLLLRTLAGLIVHPNVAAVLAVDLAEDPINNHLLQQYLREHRYPLEEVPHRFLSLSGQWEADLEEAVHAVHRWLPQADGARRTPESLVHLSIALQCGGSDAFSGVSGNPLASSVAKEVICRGGRANLAETDELIGSEAYVLQNVRNLAVAHQFLEHVARFKERLAWHGQSAEGNPSGGNKLRGLYNIALKSIGAAMKRHPDVRLDYVVDYGERMVAPGFYFMNTPGNDLESIAGQVAGGSNLIIFITGNGSITNFPFVPTLKVMTTTQRYELLAKEMDVNAGAYLDGTAMEELSQETLELLIEVASGRQSKGERAGHSQVSIWRNWQQTDRSRLALLLEREPPSGVAIPVAPSTSPLMTVGGEPHLNPKMRRVGLVLPTSLCSGQIARLAVARLNQLNRGTGQFGRCFTTLVHTEGCGVAFASTRDIYAKTMIGYATHPLVEECLFLEHGCEKAHNDYIHLLLAENGLSEAAFGWASVQLDGGIENVIERICEYFQQENSRTGSSSAEGAALSLAIMAEGHVADEVAGSLALVVQEVIRQKGSAVVPHDSPLHASHAFRQALSLGGEQPPSLAYGQQIKHSGFHLMETPTTHWSETVTGLGATGVHLIVALTDKPRAGHPFVPVLMVGGARSPATSDLVLKGDVNWWPHQLWELIGAVVANEAEPKAFSQNNTDFQLTRGPLGIST